MEKKTDFFEFMHNTIWPLIEQYVAAHKDDKELNEDFEKGKSALIMAYGASGMANWGTREALKHRIRNILFESLKKDIMTKRGLKHLCDSAIERYDEYIDETEDEE